MSLQRIPPVLFAVLLSAALARGGLAAQGIRVSAPLARDRQSAESVEDFRLSLDGSWAVFLADPEWPAFQEVFSVPVAGGAWHRLSAPGAASGGLRAGAGRAVFLSQVPGAVRHGLYSAPLDGSAPPVPLHPPLEQGRIEAYEIAAATGRVVYVADASELGRYALHSAPVDGSGPALELAGSVAAEGDVVSFRIAPDGATVVFRADRLADEVFELWSVPTDGSSAPRRLSPPLVPGGDVPERYEITADGARAVFVADASVPLTYELWSAPLDASAPPIRLDGPSLLGGVTVDALPSFQLTPDGAKAVFRAHRSSDEIVQLYVVPVDGSAQHFRIGGPVLAGGGVLEVYPIPPGGRVAYLVVPAEGAPTELRSAPLDGSLGVRLNAPLAPWAGFARVVVGSDGRRVVYACDQEADERFELWSAPMEGGAAPVRLSALAQAEADVADFRLGGGRVVYRADARQDECFELWSVPDVGSQAPVRLSGALQLHGDVAPRVAEYSLATGFDLTPDGTRVVYRADAAMDESYELWSVPAGGGAPPRVLSMPLDPGEVWDDVIELEWSPGGQRLLYTATDRTSSRHPSHDVLSADLARLALDGPVPVVPLGKGSRIVVSPDDAWAVFARGDTGCEDEPCSVRLLSAPIDGSAPARVLMETTGRLLEYRHTPDASRVVFGTAYESGPYYSSGLWSVPSDGSAEMVLLSVPGGGFEPGPFVGPFAHAAEGRVVFLEYHDGRSHVYSVPVAGGVPIALEPPLLEPGQSVHDLRVTPDGRAVVFAADALVPGADEVFLAPSDGSVAAVRIGPPRVHPSTVRGIEIDPYGTRAVFGHDRELWSAPLAPSRGEVPVRLDEKPVPGGGVAYPVDGRAQFALAPDGSRAVYRAEQDALGRFELFSVALDGSAVPVRLHAPLSSDQDVAPDAFAITSSGRVVFVADLDVPGVPELFVAPLDGSAPPVRLSAAFPAGGGLRTPTSSLRDAFALSPDGLTVAYLADQRTAGTTELFAVPSDGSRAPRRLNRELVPGGDVGLMGEVREPFAFSPDGLLVAYLADQETDDVVELFVSYVDPPRLRRAPPPRPLR